MTRSCRPANPANEPGRDRVLRVDGTQAGCRGLHGETAMTALGRTLALALILVAVPCAAEEKPAVDRFGDPLPPGAIARLGTTRWRGAMIRSIDYLRECRIITDSHSGER